MIGKVVELFITLDDKDKTRKNVSKIRLDAQGILKDKFYNKNDQRAILISSLQSYELAKKNSIEIPNGSLGENILIDINPYALSKGQKIRIASCTLQITQNCTICKGLSSVDSKLPKLLKDDRGIFARVIEGNYEISTGDKVEILSH